VFETNFYVGPLFLDCALVAFVLAGTTYCSEWSVKCRRRPFQFGLKSLLALPVMLWLVVNLVRENSTPVTVVIESVLFVGLAAATIGTGIMATEWAKRRRQVGAD
jgi:hypothetical protein